MKAFWWVLILVLAGGGLCFADEGAVGAKGAEEAWRLEPVEMKIDLAFYGDVVDAAISPEGKFLFVGTEAGKISEYRLEEGDKVVYVRDFRLPAELGPVEGFIHSLAVSKDGKLLAAPITVGKQKNVGDFDSLKTFLGVWQTSDGQMVKALDGRTAFFGRVSISDDDKLLACASINGKFSLWNIESGEMVHEFVAAGDKEKIECAVFFPGGKKMVTGTRDNHVMVWDVGEWKSEQELEVNRSGKMDCFNTTLDPEGKLIAMQYLWADRVDFWDRETLKPVKQLVIGGAPGGDVRLLDFSGDGKLFVAVEALRTFADTSLVLSVWKTGDFTKVAGPVVLGNPLYQVFFLPGGKRILGVGKHELMAWDIVGPK